MNKFDKKTIFESERILLRRFHEDDNIAMYNILGNSTTMKFLGNTLKKEEIDSFIINISNLDYKDFTGEYAIILKESKELIGMYSIKYKKRDRKAEISYLLNPKYWNKGYTFEICRKVIGILFTNFNTNKIIADCDNANISSKNLLIKLGFKEEGFLHSDRFSINDNKFYDVVLFGLLKEDYYN